MRYFVGVALGVLCVSFVWADQGSNPIAPRTPNGMLWAGTTFNLQARAVMNNQTVAISDAGTVRVGQVRRWQATPLNSNLVHLPSGNYLYQVRLENTGNGMDQFQFALTQQELTGDQRWNLALFEDQNNTRSTSGNPQISMPGTGSVIAPGMGMVYLLRVTPPSSSVPTDGVWAQVLAGLVGSQNLQRVGDTVVAGTMRNASVVGRSGSYSGSQNHVDPILTGGRIFWMGTDSNNETRIFHAPYNSANDANPFGTREVYSRRLTNFVPSGFSEVFGSSWFVGNQDGQLLRIPLQTILQNNTATDPRQVVSLPGGARVRLDLKPFQLNNRLFVVGTDNRLHALREDGTWLAQSMRLPSNVGNISCAPVVLMKRHAVVGTDQGWLIFVDMLTGNIQTTRRVDNSQPVRHLVVNRDERLILAVVGERRLMGINSRQGTVQWSRMVEEGMGAIVSNLAYDRENDSVFFLTRLGHLFGVHAFTGLTRPLYPQQVIEVDSTAPLTQATVQVTRRQ
ncbi:MAG: hypothetical protein SNJ72_06405, partial [Fimbriimonadales bacterium]